MQAFSTRFSMLFFVSDAPELSSAHRRLIEELKRSVGNGDAQERTAATLTVLKLCESESDSDESEIRA